MACFVWDDLTPSFWPFYFWRVLKKSPPPQSGFFCWPVIRAGGNVQTQRALRSCCPRGDFSPSIEPVARRLKRSFRMLQGSGLSSPDERNRVRLFPALARSRFGVNQGGKMEAYRIERFGSVDGIVLRPSEVPRPGLKDILIP